MCSEEEPRRASTLPQRSTYFHFSLFSFFFFLHIDRRVFTTFRNRDRVSLATSFDPLYLLLTADTGPLSITLGKSATF